MRLSRRYGEGTTSYGGTLEIFGGGTLTDRSSTPAARSEIGLGGGPPPLRAELARPSATARTVIASGPAAPTGVHCSGGTEVILSGCTTRTEIDLGRPPGRPDRRTRRATICTAASGVRRRAGQQQTRTLAAGGFAFVSAAAIAVSTTSYPRRHPESGPALREQRHDPGCRARITSSMAGVASGNHRPGGTVNVYSGGCDQRSVEVGRASRTSFLGRCPTDSGTGCRTTQKSSGGSATHDAFGSGAHISSMRPQRETSTLVAAASQTVLSGRIKDHSLIEPAAARFIRQVAARTLRTIGGGGPETLSGTVPLLPGQVQRR